MWCSVSWNQRQPLAPLSCQRRRTVTPCSWALCAADSAWLVTGSTCTPARRARRQTIVPRHRWGCKPCVDLEVGGPWDRWPVVHAAGTAQDSTLHSGSSKASLWQPGRCEDPVSRAMPCHGRLRTWSVEVPGISGGSSADAPQSVLIGCYGLVCMARVRLQGPAKPKLKLTSASQGPGAMQGLEPKGPCSETTSESE